MELHDAINRLLQAMTPVSGTCQVPVADSLGRNLAEDITAPLDQPPFARSALDGYAVRRADVRGASRAHPVSLTVLGEVDAGHVTELSIREGTAIRIMTGAPIPQGADCVIRQEHTDYGEEVVEIYEDPPVHEGYCEAGEDFHAGDLLLKKGTVIGAVECGILAQTGRSVVTVYRRLRAMVLSTGDELTEPGNPLAKGKIYDSNLYMTEAFLREQGVEIVDKQVVPDDAARCAAQIRAHLQDVDLIVTTGGVSVGKCDIMHEVLTLTGAEQLFWQVDIKPGSPFLAAMVAGKPLLCTSGNPYGAFVTLALLVRPVVRRMGGCDALFLHTAMAGVQGSFSRSGGMRRFVRAFYRDGSVTPAAGSHGNGTLSTLAGCNCLMEIPPDTPFVSEGDVMKVYLL